MAVYGFVQNNPLTRVDDTGLKAINWDDYFYQWIIDHPGLTLDQYSWVEMELARGCVGLTCVNLGWTKNKWPDDTKCYRKRKQAQKRAEEMKKNCACGIGSTLEFLLPAEILFSGRVRS